MLFAFSTCTKKRTSFFDNVRKYRFYGNIYIFFLGSVLWLCIIEIFLYTRFHKKVFQARLWNFEVGFSTYWWKLKRHVDVWHQAAKSFKNKAKIRRRLFSLADLWKPVLKRKTWIWHQFYLQQHWQSYFYLFCPKERKYGLKLRRIYHWFSRLFAFLHLALFFSSR